MMAGEKGKKWMDAALELALHETWAAIEPRSDADKAWRAYFNDIGFTPAVVKMGGTYTMPVPMPYDLPHNWQPIPPEPRRYPDPHL